MAKHEQSEWQIVFIICAGVFLVGGTSAILLLEVEMQPWAELDAVEAMKLEDKSAIVDK